MDGFTYNDIFQTKGTEYLIIIAFLMLLIPFWMIINKKQAIVMMIREALGTLNLGILKIRRGIFYSRNHTWAYLEPSGEARVGLDDLLMHATGQVKLHYAKSPDDQINKGEYVAEIEHDGKRLQIFSPLTGRVVRTNLQVLDEPGIMNADPYGQGWLLKIMPDNWVDETKSYYLSDDAVLWFKNELDKLKDFMAVSLGKSAPEHKVVILQEGGELSDHPLAEMPGEIWQDFQHEFLDKPF